ncbi:MAG: hypothetical protein ABIR31_02375, partial [Ginsengibacter sp.]
IEKMQSLHGLSAEQSHGILNTITGYIKEKFPMVAGAIDNLFQAGTTPSSPGTTPAETQTATNATPPDNGDLLDKISDFIPGATGQKIEDFAKDKLGGFFGEKAKDNI